ncbi:hypothetical protein S7335_2414 [Synechococcus sp. PCC 7335]|nr:hypothetical protein S7335_2414 [Synechococcus sp. PCC 7335]
MSSDCYIHCHVGISGERSNDQETKTNSLQDTATLERLLPHF